MIQLLLLALGVVLSLLHYNLAKAKKSRLRQPDFMNIFYKYWLFFTVGMTQTFYGIERLYYSYSLAQTFQTTISASLQYDLSLYSLSLGLLGLIAPFATRSFRAAVIIGYSFITLSAASLQLFELLNQNGYTFSNVNTLAYGFIVPLVLIGLFFIGDTKKSF
ncbi:MAG: DUF6790 family protein [Negativicutes bacterium]|jgi:hypothetical protein